jgi:hypothetical protein
VSLTDTEYAVLRQTIASRGTARMILVPVTFVAWATLSLVSLLFTGIPLASLLTLAVLAAGFEAIHALHVGVERVGRYIQVFYENGGDGPRWETTAMAVGPSLPGGGIDPLFAVLFVAAALLNVMAALLPQPTPLEIGVVSLVHAGFVFRVVRARGAAARQRAVELESYRALRMRQSDRQ